MAATLMPFVVVALCLLSACGPGAARDAQPASSTKPPAPARADQPNKSVPVEQPAPPAGMVFVRGGEFFMGIDGPTQETGRTPGGVVSVRALFVDRLEVVAGDYLECQREGRCSSELHAEGRACNASAKPIRSNHPMNCVTWIEAARYCEVRGKRLPSAAEWEFAARGTDRRAYPWGNALPAEQLCWQGRKGERKSATCPVGSFPDGASPSGALDMSGNVEEWTTTVIPGAFPAPIYETRGGNYEFDPVEEAEWTDRRVDLPGSGNPTSPRPTLGFRCVKDVAG